ncbi:DsbA family oxidoreductase [Novosphingobium taihuense]|uniref:Putative DsbA family dithiol-disulfide isomerase n=1 Tax=Novosphingobium taihuense TaxID=260085 RepID=A0A7W7AAG2_9SPHN|nr:DsbA family oxidoreductase [Novosphingobium taihuense]MBB4613266.1 putative DsbA family dithiol-disulfide isomerase [Novosphingobium taihuense]TWH85407.1 putative DsbA family dithiol-disulfide isomerase [Novosphingobium taihuense]
MTASTPAKVTLDIWSDVMCPWCVIGLKQLDKALAGMAGEVDATVRFHPFELNPDMPEEGEEQSAHIQRKYGRTPEQSAGVRETLKGAAERAGYSFDYTGEGEAPPAMMWNTRMAHRLLTWALRDYGPGRQVDLKRALFDAHFKARRNVSDPEVLAEVAEAIGLPRLNALQALIDPQLDAIVTTEERQAWDWNVTGVPAVVINGKLIVPGAQEPQVYADLIRKVLAREAAGKA